MQKLGLNEIRKRYLEFFESKGHLCMNSFSLVPQNDPSVLLINAGMTPLKPYFTGAETPPCTRVTTCQKCIRTPDIERVGLTARHGTYFEMLGNFSFGDYFKREAIFYAWEFLTKVLEMPEEKLYISVYLEDDEAYDIWHKEVGIPEHKIYRMGKADNFWEHGTGPCGPCSEIYFDRGEAYGKDEVMGGDGDRFVEFWNLVFSQFDRQEDGSYLPLANKNIDTGAGLERVACLMQGVDSLFEVDTVRKILDKACSLAKVEYGKDAKTDVAIRVITDHVRSTTMMISDGVLPSNEGRGYVLRRLLRRAARFGKLLGIEGAFLHQIVPVVIEENQEAYPELLARREHILRTFLTEEKKFAETIHQGMALLETYLQDLKKEGKTVLEGELAFKLHDTYGFPLDLTKEILAEQNISLDVEAFNKEMTKQKEMARAALKAKGNGAWGGSDFPKELENLEKTKFVGYERLEENAKILAILGTNEKGETVLLDEAGVDQEILFVVDQTPFYATSGGQEGDTGSFSSATCKGEILATTKTEQGLFLHHAKVLSGSLLVEDELSLKVNVEKRLATERNHSATHLLHLALRKRLGAHVTQAGSSQNAEKTRFDFHHAEALTKQDLKAIEAEVQANILQNHLVHIEEMPIEKAKEKGAMALFGEKYGKTVRVVQMGDSLELCGGTHVRSTAEIAYFRIVGESSVASGVRRIEALTGEEAFALAQKEEALLSEVCQQLKVAEHQLLERVRNLQAELKLAQKQVQELEQKQALEASGNLLAKKKEHKDVQYLVEKVSVPNGDALRSLAENLRDKLGTKSFVFLATETEEKVLFVACAGKEAVQNKVHAGALVKLAASLCGGGGGGRPDFAQAGAKDASKLEQALQQVEANLIQELVA